MAMVDFDPTDTDGTQGALALVTMLSKSVYATVAERDGSSAKLKQIIALSYLRELGSVLCLDANNTVLLLNDLERDGLVVRKRDAEDRRRHVVELTETGHAVLHETELGMFEIEDDLLAALDEEQRIQLKTLLHEALYGSNGVLQRRMSHPASPV
jgi:DNA-binding MarR family transcriptional regulator